MGKGQLSNLMKLLPNLSSLRIESIELPTTLVSIARKNSEVLKCTQDIKSSGLRLIDQYGYKECLELMELKPKVKKTRRMYVS